MISALKKQETRYEERKDFNCGNNSRADYVDRSASGAGGLVDEGAYNDLAGNLFLPELIHIEIKSIAPDFCRGYN